MEIWCSKSRFSNLDSENGSFEKDHKSTMLPNPDLHDFERKIKSFKNIRIMANMRTRNRFYLIPCLKCLEAESWNCFFVVIQTGMVGMFVSSPRLLEPLFQAHDA
jgi:hypothetical protein